MKKKAVIIIAVIAISAATAKTGYAFYEKQLSNNQTNVIQATAVQTDFLESENISELAEEASDTNVKNQSAVNDPTFAASDQADDSFTGGNCCAGTSGNSEEADGFSQPSCH